MWVEGDFTSSSVSTEMFCLYFIMMQAVCVHVTVCLDKMGESLQVIFHQEISNDIPHML